MVPRSFIAAALVAIMAIPAMAQNFITYQRGPQEARSREILQRAERCRKDIAIAWFGEELTGWQRPCAITWRIDRTRGSGATTYGARIGEMGTMQMQVNGTWERLMNDVIPHEVFHLVMRDKLGFSMARWMDEGAASTAESDDAMTLMEKKLVEYLLTSRGIPFNAMMMAREYPPDVLPFYAQSVSATRFLLAKHGPAKFLELAKMQQRNRSWTNSVREVYGYSTLASMQNDWLAWVKAGSPPIQSQLVKPVTQMKPIPRSQAPYRPTDQLSADRMLQQRSLELTAPANATKLTGQHYCPPGTTPAPSVAPPSTTPPPTSGTTPGSSVKIQIDYAKLAAALAKYPQLQGEDGKDGRDGADGQDGKPGKDGMDGSPGVPGTITPEQIQNIVEQLASRVPTPPSEQEIVMRVVAALKNDNLVCNCNGTDKPTVPGAGEPTIPPNTGSDQPVVPPAAGAAKPSRVLYFTSEECTNCEPLDNTVERYKRNGWPITIITLREQDTEVYRVPQIFVPDTEQHAVGWQEVNAFLYTYLEGGQNQ